MLNSLKKLSICIISTLLVGAFSLSAMAQAPTGRKYKLNAQINMDWMNIDPETGQDYDVEKFMAKIGLGIFLTDMFEVGPEITYSKYDKENSEELTCYSVGVKGNAHFTVGDSVISYAGLNVSYSSVDDGADDDSTFSYGGQVGMDYFVTERMSVNPELRYTMSTYSFDGGDVDVSDIILMVGIAGHF